MTDRNDIENDDIENNTLDALSRLVLQLEADARALAQTAATAQGREQQQGNEREHSTTTSLNSSRRKRGEKCFMVCTDNPISLVLWKVHLMLMYCVSST